MAEERSQVNVNDEYIEKYGFHEAENYTFKSRKGLDVEIVKEISRMKKEPEWMTDFRVRSYEAFVAKPMPNWGSEVLGQIDFNDIFYYIKPTDGQSKTWEDLPAEIKNTYDRLGIPEAEKKYLAGVGAQYESEVIYHSLAKDLESKGVLFTDTDSALRDHPEIFREYFGTIIPYTDNKFAALNSAVWSGGSFIYVPKGVKIDMPLQAYFRINAKNVGQFERTLIIVDEGAQVHYVEGCFLAGARIRVKGGEKPIEQIQVGDEVLTHKGRYRRVYNTMQRPYSGTIYNIKYFGDSRQMLRVTEEHPLLVVKRELLHNRNREFKPEWMAASQVKPGDYLAIPIPKTESQTQVSQKVVTIPFAHGRNDAHDRNVTLNLEPDFFRLLGYYYAEGHVDNEHYLTFTFNASETTYLEDTKELVTRYFGKAPNANKARLNGQTLVLSSTETARTFAREFGSSIRDKRVPEYVL